MSALRTYRSGRNCRRTSLYRRGAAVVEFAVVSPVLILVLLGIIECGRMIMVQQALTTAVREGARTAAIAANPASAAKKAVKEFLAGAGVSGGKVRVTSGAGRMTAHGEPITVMVSVPFREVSWLPHPLFLKNAVLNSTATMRRETPN